MRNLLTKIFSSRKEKEKEEPIKPPVSIRSWEEIYATMKERIEILKEDDYSKVFKQGSLSDYLRFSVLIKSVIMTKEERNYYSINIYSIPGLYTEALNNFFNNEPLYNKELWIKWYFTYFEKEAGDTDLLMDKLYDLRYESEQITPIKDFVRTIKEFLSSDEYIIKSVKQEI